LKFKAWKGAFQAFFVPRGLWQIELEVRTAVDKVAVGVSSATEDGVRLFRIGALN